MIRSAKSLATGTVSVRVIHKDGSVTDYGVVARRRTFAHMLQSFWRWLTRRARSI
jgi:hypothetical protein